MSNRIISIFSDLAFFRPFLDIESVVFFCNLIGKDHLVKLIKTNRNVFLNTFENITDDFPISKHVLLRFLDISKHRYMIWLNERASYCNNSIIGQCFKRRPNQISPLEINVLKRYMNNLKYKIWCIRSV